MYLYMCQHTTNNTNMLLIIMIITIVGVLAACRGDTRAQCSVVHYIKQSNIMLQYMILHVIIRLLL